MSNLSLKRKVKIFLGIKFQEIFGNNLTLKFLKFMKLKKNDEIELISEFLLKKTQNGIMLDVGAQIGNSFNTLASNGWKVFSFEPNPACLEILNRRASLFRGNVKVFPYGISNKNKNAIDFYTAEKKLGISSLHNFHPDHKAKIKIDLKTLECFSKQHEIRFVNFLKIDTEGHDIFVLKGIDWNFCNFEVILCEYEDKKTLPLGYSYKDICDYLKSYGYKVLISEWKPIKSYGSKHEWEGFKYPNSSPDIDTASWGNILATKNEELFEWIKRKKI